jgi:8-oxo-dGTP pyrophosphatase MutT (NUDIX family)
MDTVAQVIFADIRGFTKWGEDTEVFANLDSFIGKFQVILKQNFPDPWFVKGLGDGAMLVYELGEKASPPSIKELDRLVRAIQLTDKKFDQLCSDFGRSIGHETLLKLGWGLVRGKIKPLPHDYVGPNLNKCARLCNEARPYGIVIDKDDYPDAPTIKQAKFYPQIRKLVGIGDVSVWVTEAIGFEFLTREKIKHTPEVHVAGLCIDTNDKRGTRVLLARRADTRKLFPGKLEGCGGQLAQSETFTEGVVRHFRLEMKIEVRVLETIHCFYTINERHEPTVIPGIRFLCERVSDNEPQSINHSSVDWVFEKELKNMPADDFVGGLKEEAIQLLAVYKKEKNST